MPHCLKSEDSFGVWVFLFQLAGYNTHTSSLPSVRDSVFSRHIRTQNIKTGVPMMQCLYLLISLILFVLTNKSDQGRMEET